MVKRLTEEELMALMVYITKKGQQKNIRTKDIMDEIGHWIRNSRKL